MGAKFKAVDDEEEEDEEDSVVVEVVDDGEPAVACCSRALCRLPRSKEREPDLCIVLMLLLSNTVLPRSGIDGCRCFVTCLSGKHEGGEDADSKVSHALASIQLARFDIIMYFPPLPIGGLVYFGEVW